MEDTEQLRYIVLSDLHLGEVGSLFTPRNEKDYKLVHALSDCLADLLLNFNQKELPSLVFNGDILGLAFSTHKESLTVFQEFVKAFTRQNKICNSIAYIPGNHDHHIWNMSKESQFLEALRTDRSQELPELRNTTGPLFEDGFDSPYFKAFFGEGGTVDLKVLYPNFLLPPDEKGDPYVLFHHGHFSENTYHFITKAMQALYPDMPTPKNLNSLELENGAWIDFAFSQLGRSGEAGSYFEKLMATLSSKELLKEHLDELSTHLAASVDFPYLPMEWMERLLANKLIYNIADQVRGERYKGATACSDETLKGLMHYLNTYCYEALGEQGWNGEDITLVWSHTHKPFEKITKTEKFNKLQLMNTGGWVLPPAPVPKIGGSIMLINKKNEVQALRIYNDSDIGGEMHFKISFPDGASETPFSRHIMNGLYRDNEELHKPWTTFKMLLQDEFVQRRKKNS